MYKENDDIVINLTITSHCYAQCKGCINGSLTFAKLDDGALTNLECDPQRDAVIVLAIAEKYPEQDITLCFYGGEPFLNPERMHSICTIINKSSAGRRIRYMVYTNGELMADTIEKYPELIQSIWLYSISVDGSSAQHQRVRPGTSLSKIISGLEQLRQVYKGNILMWSTLREEQSLLDCYNQFIALHRHGLSDHFFWHWADTRQPFSNFKKYSAEYEAELEQIMRQYVSWLSDGEILPIAHINELILYFLEKRQRGHTACAVELARNYDIRGGKVHACADLPDSFGVFALADDTEIPASKLQSLIEYKKKLGCNNCSVHWYCGGRCPVQVLAGSPERTLQICKLMHIHVNTVKDHIGYIMKMLQKYRISHQKIYDSSAFITRYTDVVP
ncbi:MAG: 4Fe-4S cluster-binding domain-containing protein [Dehalococcoidia bacterium]|nr:4Fe-4S cluster-binding domain-containing protein [Dehalococcoidia bacterium]MDD5493280.1 4Fe-4S cluster-binding domain-containing protein [Dehalococcoidia bacterium]